MNGERQSGGISLLSEGNKKDRTKRSACDVNEKEHKKAAFSVVAENGLNTFWILDVRHASSLGCYDNLVVLHQVKKRII